MTLMFRGKGVPRDRERREGPQLQPVLRGAPGERVRHVRGGGEGGLRQAFNKLDVDGTGTITADDLKKSHDFSHNPKVLSGEETVDQLLSKHLAMFEGAGATDGKVTKKEFQDYYNALSASIDSDDYFELMMKNAYKL
ncbi:unnamed protein product [Darwinula stevensoni]|uniref:EF-hand domain-containing protein n=1 Tax=Darwinula stevensoni TaxID=69355 RepID=A0A7R9AES2_9CRUS|nr:unnamed protein product [Darwinula stevensoni]CAG0901916.1 unnamed protein product [Darwinula stevensoni]